MRFFFWKARHKKKSLIDPVKRSRVVFVSRKKRRASQKIWERLLALNRPAATVIAGLLVVSVFLYTVQVSGLNVDLYPNECEGSWQQPQLASGMPDVSEDATPEMFNRENSAVFGEGNQSIVCHGFDRGDVNDTAKISGAQIRFSLAVKDTEVKKEMPEVPVSEPAMPVGGVEEQVDFVMPSQGDEPVLIDGGQASDESDLKIINNAAEAPTEVNKSAGDNPDAPSEAPTPAENQPAETPNESAPASEPSAEPSSEPAPSNNDNGQSEPSSGSEQTGWLFIHKAQAQEGSMDIPQEEVVEADNDNVSDADEQEDLVELDDDPVASANADHGAGELDDNTSGGTNRLATISYSFDGSTWYELGELTEKNWDSLVFDLPLSESEESINADAKGVGELSSAGEEDEAYVHGPAIANWQDIEALQFKVDGSIFSLDESPVVYLDGLHLHVEYEEGEEELLTQAEIDALPHVEVPASEIFGYEQDDFRADEEPGFEVILSNPEEVAPAEVPVENDNTEASTIEERLNDLQDKVEELQSPVSSDSTSSSQGESSTTNAPERVPTSGATDEIPEGEEAPAANRPMGPDEPRVKYTTYESSKAYGFYKAFGIQTVSAQTPPEKPVRLKVLKADILDPEGKPTEMEALVDDKNGRLKINVPKPVGSFRPGKYKMEVEILSDETVYVTSQVFTWGVLAINTNQATYVPGARAYVQMAALDDRGHTRCDADLSLVIISPLGEEQSFSVGDGSIVKNKTCGPDNVTDEPDYFAYYDVSEVGTYLMKLKDNSTGYEITDAFLSVSELPVEIERITATRIYPPEKYEVTIKVKAHEDLTGVVYDRTPSNFVIGDTFGNVSVEGNENVIVFGLDMEAGETKTLTYTYDAPDVSPYLYLLGPLKMEFSTKEELDAALAAAVETVATAAAVEDLADTVVPAEVAPEPAASKSASVNASESVPLNRVLEDSRSWQIASDAVTADGRLFYNRTDSAGTLRFQTWSLAGGWSATTTTTIQPVASQIGHLIAKHAPTRDETFIAALHINGTMSVTKCVGGCDAAADWTGDTADNFTKAGVDAVQTCDATLGACERPFDLAYEQLSGDALVVFSTTTASSGKLQYCEFTGATWSGSNCATPSVVTMTGSTGIFQWVQLISQGGEQLTRNRTNRILMVAKDANSDIFAAIWDGSSWGDVQPVTETGSTATTLNFDGAWETTGSERAVVAWGNGTANSTAQGGYMTWSPTSSQWSASSSIGTFEESSVNEWLMMKSDPKSDRICMTTQGAGEGVSGWMWRAATTSQADGWTVGRSDAAGAEDDENFGSACAWEKDNGVGGWNGSSPTSSAIYIWTDQGADGSNGIIDYFTWDNSAGFSAITAWPGTVSDDPMAFADRGVRGHPNNDSIMAINENIDCDLEASAWTTSTWQAESDIAPAGSVANGDDIPTDCTAAEENGGYYFIFNPYSPWSRNWRFYSDYTTTTPATALAAENTTPSSTQQGNFVRLRVQVEEMAGTAAADQRKVLQWVTSTTCPNPDSCANSNWTPVADSSSSSAPWRYATTSEAFATARDGLVVASSTLTGTTQAGTLVLDSDDTASTSMDFSALAITEMDFIIKAQVVTSSETYYFRVYDFTEGTVNYRKQATDASTTCLSAACTYPSIAIAPSPTFTQNVYGWFANNDGVQPGSALASENATGTIAATSTIVRLRMSVTLSQLALATSAQAFMLQFTTSTTPSSATWTDVATSGTAIIFKDNGTPADDAAITSTLLTGSDVKQSYQEDNPTDANPVAVAVGQDMEWDFSLDPVNAVDGTTYYFRMVTASSTEFAAYTRYPALTVASPPILSGWRWFSNATSSSATSSGWYSSSWGYRKKITIDEAYVTGTADLTDFPVLINTTDTDWEFTSHGGKVASSTGADILFTSSDGYTKLSHEIETYTSSTGELVAWVKVPTLQYATDTVIYAYYGNAAATDQQSVTSTWDSSYKAVWHMDNDPGGAPPQLFDSTVNTNTGTASGSMTSADLVSGKIGESVDFDGSDDHFDIGTLAADIATGSVTITSWVQFPTTFSSSSAFDRYLFNLSDSPSNNDIRLHFEEADGQFKFFKLTSATISTTQNSWDGGTWYHVGAVLDTTTGMALYINGSLATTSSAAARGATAAALTYIGKFWNDATSNFLGRVDEMKVSKASRSAAWIATEYNNQNDPSAFYIIASPEASSSAMVGSPIADLNTATTSPEQGTPFRLRTTLHSSSSIVAGDVFSLQFAEKSGTCDVSFSGESYSDVATSTGAIRFYDNTGLSDADRFRATSTDPTHGEHLVVAQTYEEGNTFTATSTVASGQDGLWDFALVDYSAAPAASYCFRVVRTDGATSTPLYVPEITTYSPPVSFTQNEYRWYAAADGVQPGSSLASENSSYTTTTLGQARLRMNVTVGGSTLSTSTQAFKLQFATSSVSSVTVGPTSTATVVNDTSTGTVAWTNPGNATTSDNLNATATVGSTVISNYLKATNFGFSIPSDATIDGIVVTFERAGGAATSDNSVKIVKGGSISGTEMASTSLFWGGESEDSYGSSTELWGLTWTASDINSSDFGVALSGTCAGGSCPAQLQVDHIKITVYYTGYGWTDVATSTGDIRFYNNTTPADDAAITSNLLTSSDAKQSYQEDNPTDANPTAATVGQDMEWDFSLDIATTTVSNYYFRMVEDDGTELGTYTRYPTLNMGSPYVSGYRWFATSSEPSVVFSTSSNPGVADLGLTVAIDQGYVYLAGSAAISGENNWYFEKRSLSDGSIIWSTSSDPGGNDRARAVVVDDAYIYVAGMAQPSNNDFRIEKRNLSDGALVDSFTEDVSGLEYFHSLAQDVTYLYAVGSTAGEVNWSIQKRDKSTLDLVGSRVTINAGTTDVARGIAIDSTYMYVVGFQDDVNWRIEKRLLSDLSSVASTTSNPGTTDRAYSIAIDNQYMYVVGEQDDVNWRIEKRNLSDLALVTSTTSNPGATDEAYNIAIDGSYMYVVGISGTSNNRLEKRNLSDLSLVYATSSNGSAAASQNNGIAADGSRIIYLSTVDNADSDWSIRAYQTDIATSSALNTATTTPSVTSTPFILRSTVHASRSIASTETFKLQVAEKSGTCDVAYSGETYTDVATSTGVIRFTDLSGRAHDSLIHGGLDDATHTTDLLRGLTHVEQNNFSASGTTFGNFTRGGGRYPDLGSALTSGSDGVWQFALRDTGTNPGVAYCFRIVDANGATSTPLYVPEITTYGTPATGITVSGTVYSDQGITTTTSSVKLAVNGTTGYTTSTDASGNFTFTSVAGVSSGTLLTVWMNNNGGGNGTGAVVTLASSSGNLAGLNIYKNYLIVRHENTGPLTDAHLELCNYTIGLACGDNDLHFGTGAQLVSIDADWGLYIWPGDTFTTLGSQSDLTLENGALPSEPGGDIVWGSSTSTLEVGSNWVFIGGDWHNAANGSFTTDSGQVTTFTATTTGFSINPGSRAFRNVTFNGVGGSWSPSSSDMVVGLDSSAVDGNLTMTAGTLNNSNGTSSIQVYNGDVTGAGGVISLTNASFTVTLAATSSQGFGSTSGDWTFNDLVFTVATSTAGTYTFTTQTSGTGNLAIAGELTVNGGLGAGANAVLNAGNRTWTLSGTTGDPFKLVANSASADLASASSTFVYSGNNAGGNTTMQAENYWNLQIATSTETFVLEGNTTSTNDLTLTAGTLSVTNYSLDVDGNVAIASAGALTASTTGLTFAKDFNSSGTVTLGSSTVTFDTTATSTISGATSSELTFWNFTSQTGNKPFVFATSTQAFRVNGLLTLTGTAGNLITIDSNSSGTQWLINHQGTEDVRYVTVKDSGCVSTSTYISVSYANSVDRGNNAFCWAFPSLSFSISPLSIDLSLGDTNTFTASATNTLTVTTNGEFGYSLTGYATDLLTRVGATTTIANWTGTNASPTVWTTNCINNSDCGFGYNTDDADITQFTTNEFAAFSTSTPGDEVAASAGRVTGEATTMTYRVSVDRAQAAGDYQTTIRFIVAPKF